MPIFHDPAAVAAAHPNPTVRGRINRGLELENVIGETGKAVGGALSGAGRAADYLLGTNAASKTPGFITRGVGALSDFAQKNPKATVGAAVLAPILLNAFNSSRRMQEDQLMNAYLAPANDVTTDDPRRMKTSADAPKTPPPSGGPKAPSKIWSKNFQNYLQELSHHSATAAAQAVSKARPAEKSLSSTLGMSVLEGAGKGLGGVAAGVLAQGIGHGVDMLRDHFILEPKRKQLFERLLSSDPVLSDALHRNPEAKGIMLEAYGTMVRFAPSLSLDINAVRSFLREAVLGGSGVNYATIKNLVDTEKSVADSKPRFGGK